MSTATRATGSRSLTGCSFDPFATVPSYQTAPPVLAAMIAAVAWRQQAAILACDADLDRVARVAGIELDRPPEAG